MNGIVLLLSLMTCQLFAQTTKQPVLSVTAATVAAQAKAESGQQPGQPTTINKILFTEGNQSWTSRDEKLYRKMLLEFTGKDQITPYAESRIEDFLFSRILKREALLFEIESKDLKLVDASKASFGDFSKREIEQEAKMISQALALLELREKQMSQKIRFKAWMDVLIKKYSVKIKSDEL